MNLKNNKTYIALKKKASGEGRMPSIKSIHELLDAVGIDHWYYETQNVVEYRSGLSPIVNSRHDGKSGYEVRFRAFVKDIKKSPFVGWGGKTDTKWIHLDTSDSYYSWNSHRYAADLIDVLDNYKHMTFSNR